MLREKPCLPSSAITEKKWRRTFAHARFQDGVLHQPIVITRSYCLKEVRCPRQLRYTADISNQMHTLCFTSHASCTASSAQRHKEIKIKVRKARIQMMSKIQDEHGPGQMLVLDLSWGLRQCIRRCSAKRPVAVVRKALLVPGHVTLPAKP